MRTNKTRKLIPSQEIEVYEGISNFQVKNHATFFDQNKKINLDNMYEFRRDSKKIDDILEKKNFEILKSINIIKKIFPFRMQENLLNFENYFQKFDEILENRIYSKLMPMVFLSI